MLPPPITLLCGNERGARGVFGADRSWLWGCQRLTAPGVRRAGKMAGRWREDGAGEAAAGKGQRTSGRVDLTVATCGEIVAQKPTKKNHNIYYLFVQVLFEDYYCSDYERPLHASVGSWAPRSIWIHLHVLLALVFAAKAHLRRSTTHAYLLLSTHACGEPVTEQQRILPCDTGTETALRYVRSVVLIHLNRQATDRRATKADE